ncbi:1529_t:CDS:2 [Cetraspora pellucida]|uniref:1529_t:CDS:1 n=1 Tax=Cetraspora pellucida TaxID=1433469 RepID=A0ACA9LI43_9GLOM|nr:1529_t:CDS:2 [Cetraspora pellucida]
MPKLANIKKLQKKRAEVAHSVLANYVDLDSSEEYVDSSGNSDESLDENFELNDHDQANSIIERLFAASAAAFREAARGSLKISHFFNNQLSITDHEEDAEDFQKLDGNLSEELDEETKKIHSAIEFVDNIASKRSKKMDAAKAVSDIIDGRFSSKSLLYDELVSLELAAYLRFQKFNIDPIMVKDYFEQTILSQLNIKHECPDVVEYRQTFLQEVVRLEQLMSKWVTHDETTFYTYDGPHSVWGPEKEQPLRKKGLGSAIHISDFLTETIGSLKDDQEEAWLLGFQKTSRAS